MRILVDDQNKYIHLDGWVRTSSGSCPETYISCFDGDSINAKEIYRAQNDQTMSCRSTGSALTLYAVRGSSCTFLYKFSYTT
ncbi:hypothetical protein T265_01130 [Opisthorchis viverrini]|uniref:Uncharacterized protein n=2 Tax=Opisthorchis viverrini TaxID=6198 RepID=A0A075AAM3_OPIVI|nr:hypothetical protein T265_01130 [Opisthorchis viverrini]KER32840.1 hypothetical protein T265_01130 [Opisthorchis viverrini]